MTDLGKHAGDLASPARAASRHEIRPNIRTELSPVDVSSVQEKVYQSLRLALLKGQFFPGEQVSIRSLANALGTSPMPVREAVKRLVAEKGLEQSSDRLLRVASYVASVHEEYIRIRIEVEGFATEKACASNDPLLIDKLKDHNKTMLEALHASDLESALAANQAFHFEIYRAAGYPQLLDIISNLWLRTGPILAISRHDKDLFHKIFDIGDRVHNDAIEAIARRDRMAAKRAIAIDIKAAHMSIRRYYKSANISNVNEAHPVLTRLR
jgi:DNA-binding GntR family transcriptional regulator